MSKHGLPGWAALAGLAGALVAVAPAFADVIVYSNGKTIKGLTEESPQDPTMVMLTTDAGKIGIPKSRIKEIQKETPSQGYVEIGQGYLDRGMLSEALGAFQQAAGLDPANADAKRLVDSTQGRIANQQQMTRNDAIKKIDDLEKQTNDLIAKGSFETAVANLKEAGRLVPEPEQKARLQKLIGKLYLAWAAERADKFDQLGEEKMLNYALAADPSNQEVIDRMLKLWENDPGKRDQVTNVYETMLKSHPDDQALEKKLGDLYWDMSQSDPSKTEDAVRHYLQLYKTPDHWKGTELEKRLFDGLEKLHRKYAREKKYDEAIHWYKILATLAPGTDPTAVYIYEYLKQANALQPDDNAGRLALAQWAEKTGLDKEALDNYRLVLADPKTKEGAQAGLDRYAEKTLAGVQARFDAGDYQMASTLAQQARLDFAGSPKVVNELNQIIGKAQVEVAKDTRQKRDKALASVKRGDEFYGQAMAYLNQILSTQFSSAPMLFSPRQQAIQYFQYAITAYTEALQFDPSVGTESNSLVNIRLGECRQYLNNLTAPVPLPRNNVISLPPSGNY